MLIWTIVAIGILVGAPAIVVGAVAVVAIAPVHGSIALVAAAAFQGWRKREKRAAATEEVALLRSLAGVVSAGGTLRQAISMSTSRLVTDNVRRLCAAGASIADVGDAMKPMMPTNGRQFAAMCAMSEHTGSSVAEPLVAFARRAKVAQTREQKKRTSLAQTRFSAWVVGVAPLCLTALIVATGGIPEPRTALVVIPMVVGAALQITGTAVVFVISGREAT
ncbi:MAG: hypothetical protein DWP92_03690 [Armatimonadetes bacterium]|nr:MAG: hypothetical protein DWP92_03690 [Armatimonadota bacterium]